MRITVEQLKKLRAVESRDSLQELWPVSIKEWEDLLTAAEDSIKLMAVTQMLLERFDPKRELSGEICTIISNIGFDIQNVDASDKVVDGSFCWKTAQADRLGSNPDKFPGDT